MVKNAGGKFNDYSISPKIRQFCYIGVINQLKVIYFDFSLTTLYSIRMSKKTLNFDNIEVNKNEFHNSN